MAGAGSKKRVEENKQRLRLLQGIIAVGLAAQLLIRLGLRWGSSSWTNCGIAAVARPLYNADGDLLDGGGDLNLSGSVQGYQHDVIYVTAASQVLGAATDWAWLLLVTIPGYALFALWPTISGWLSSRNEPVAVREDRRARKDRERAEKKAAQSQKAGFRTLKK